MKILLVTSNQFGYLIDYHRYYHYLKDIGHIVKYICYDTGRPKIDPENPDVFYVPNQGSKLLVTNRFIQQIKNVERENNFDKILVHYFLFVSALPFFVPRHKVILDIRTVSIHTSAYKRKLFDFLIRLAAARFDTVSILNDLSARHLGIRNYKLLPLGGARFDAEVNQPDSAEYDHLFKDEPFVFLYVGTLHKRRMMDCVRGFHAFIRKNPTVNAKFIIIGQGMGSELLEIRDYISVNSLSKMIYAPGFIPQSRLTIFFKYAGCGICYVPLTPFFDVQPSTKTYEYLINGIPVIATTIQDNVRLIENAKVPCGVLIGDTAEEFEKAISLVLNSKYDSHAIAKEFGKYEWNSLFKKYLENLFNE